MEYRIKVVGGDKFWPQVKGTYGDTNAWGNIFKLDNGEYHTCPESLDNDYFQTKLKSEAKSRDMIKSYKEYIEAQNKLNEITYIEVD